MDLLVPSKGEENYKRILFGFVEVEGVSFKEYDKEKAWEENYRRGDENHLLNEVEEEVHLVEVILFGETN